MKMVLETGNPWIHEAEFDVIFREEEFLIQVEIWCMAQHWATAWLIIRVKIIEYSPQLFLQWVIGDHIRSSYQML